MNILTAFRSESVNVTTTSWALGNVRIRPVGIHCDAQTTIVGALCGDSAETTWVLPAGSSAYAFKSIATSSTTKSGFKILWGT